MLPYDHRVNDLHNFDDVKLQRNVVELFHTNDRLATKPRGLCKTVWLCTGTHGGGEKNSGKLDQPLKI